MTCTGCVERAELLVKAREAYQRGDRQEAKRLFNEVCRTVGKDIGNLTAMVLKRPDGSVERFDFPPDKPESLS